MRVDEALEPLLIGEDSVTRECVLAVLVAADELRSRTSAILRPFGLTLQCVDVLACLDRASQPQTQGSITNLLHSNSSTVSWVMERLEGSGYVRRHRDEEDRRIVDVELTERGASALAEIRHALRQLDLLVGGGLSPADQAALLHCVGELVRQLRR